MILATDVLDDLRFQRAEYRQLAHEATSESEAQHYWAIEHTVYLFQCWWHSFLDYQAYGSIFCLEVLADINDDIQEWVGLPSWSQNE